MITVLVNPISGGGKALKVLPEIEKVLTDAKKEYIIRKTEFPGDALNIAIDAVKSAHDAIIVAGGDGTMSEVLHGVVGSAVAIMFAPCGTGNDFVKCMHIPVEPVQAIKKQLSSPLRRLDYATVNGKAFLNICGTGFDVEVLRHLAGYRAKVTGMKAYLWALMDALKNYKPLECEVSVDGAPFEKKSVCILCIGNGVYLGGGMKGVPGAVPYDGLLNLVMVNSIKKWMIPFLLPLFIFGKHPKLSICKTQTCKRVSIKTEGTMTMQLDGELVDMKNADIAIIPSGVGARY